MENNNLTDAAVAKIDHYLRGQNRSVPADQIISDLKDYLPFGFSPYDLAGLPASIFTRRLQKKKIIYGVKKL